MAKAGKVSGTEALSTLGVGLDATFGTVAAASAAEPGSALSIVVWIGTTILSHFIRKWWTNN